MLCAIVWAIASNMDMKQVVITFFLFNFCLRANATDQAPDKLFYNGLTLRLNTGWGHPSPLETYFYQTKIAYPFKMLSTGNYRGHIATWVIQNGRFYLKEVAIRSETHPPAKFGIKSITTSPTDANLVFADWFSGIIDSDKIVDKGRETTSSFYFQVRNGEIISMSEITKEDFQRISKISQNDSLDTDLITKYNLLLLNQNYIAYYYRLNENDNIQYNNRECHLNTEVSRLSPIYTYYSNQHLQWPFNWENLEQCGAPHCYWKIINDSLFLTGIQLYSGTRFDSIDKETIDLATLFSGKAKKGQVFANWVNGIQLIIYGIDTTYEFGFKDFKPKEFTYCRLENGIVKETYTIPSDFDLKKNDDTLDPKLRKLIKEY